MSFVEVVSIMLQVTGLLLIVGHHIRLGRERLQPTLRHRLFASHLTSGMDRPQ